MSTVRSEYYLATLSARNGTVSVSVHGPSEPQVLFRVFLKWREENPDLDFEDLSLMSWASKEAFQRRSTGFMRTAEGLSCNDK